ncbi:hypothetical protein FB451DRAFT_1565849 [Mycena latifolia]|nr:hypothetical protein FB451DRAFT_1565849 [Mycena latifolia]
MGKTRVLYKVAVSTFALASYHLTPSTFSFKSTLVSLSPRRTSLDSELSLTMTLWLTSPVMSSPRLTNHGLKALCFQDGFHGKCASIHLCKALRRILDAHWLHFSRSNLLFKVFVYLPVVLEAQPSSPAVREEALPDILTDPALPIGSLAPFVRGIAGSHRRSVPAIPPLICATRRRTSTMAVQPGAALAAPRVDLCSSILQRPSTGID